MVKYDTTLSPCARGSAYYSRIVKGQEQRVPCPQAFAKQRMARQLARAQFGSQLESIEQGKKRKKMATAILASAVPAAGLGVIKLASTISPKGFGLKLGAKLLQKVASNTGSKRVMYRQLYKRLFKLGIIKPK
jgi:hypothetical protein